MNNLFRIEHSPTIYFSAPCALQPCIWRNSLVLACFLFSSFVLLTRNNQNLLNLLALSQLCITRGIHTNLQTELNFITTIFGETLQNRKKQTRKRAQEKALLTSFQSYLLAVLYRGHFHSFSLGTPHNFIQNENFACPWPFNHLSASLHLTCVLSLFPSHFLFLCASI